MYVDDYFVGVIFCSGDYFCCFIFLCGFFVWYYVDLCWFFGRFWCSDELGVRIIFIMCGCSQFDFRYCVGLWFVIVDLVGSGGWYWCMEYVDWDFDCLQYSEFVVDYVCCVWMFCCCL